jgi:hypothetical protein
LAQTYLKAAKERGIELVAITEHNDVSWVEDLRYAAKGLEMHLLPGFEVESNEGIHVLCLFNPSTKVSELEDSLARLGLTKGKRAEQKRLELRADLDFAELVIFVQEECGGICIAAHMDSDKGLLSFGSGGARADRWRTKALLAGQISRLPAELHAGTQRILENADPTYERERELACLLTSDARGIDEIGTKPTWVKLDQVGVDGLRQAFLDPESRLSLTDPGERRQGPRLLAVAWEGGHLDGIAVPLNPELNALIGGKGTGKSTVIESIRFAFGLEARTPDVREAAQKLRESALPAGTKVSVHVDTGPPGARRYVIERTAPHDPVVRDETGQPLPDLSPKQLVHPDVYGQKEVYDIAQNTQARLGVLDDFAADALRDVLEREQMLAQRAEQNADLILETRRAKEDADAKLAELPNLEAWRQRFREAGFEDKLSERRLLEREGRLLEILDKGMAGAVQALAAQVQEGAPFAVVAPTDEDELPNRDLLERANALVARAVGRWTDALSSLREELEQAQKELVEIRTEWEARHAARAEEFGKALRELQERMPEVDPERYLDVERRIEELIPLREKLGPLSKTLDEAIAERARLLIDLDDARGAKHRVRLRAAEALTEATGGSVRVDLAHRADRGDFLGAIGAFKTGARADSLKRMVESDDFSPAEFARCTRDGALQGKYGLPDGQAARIERLTEEDLLSLDSIELCDQVSISLDVGRDGTREYRTLERLSPGQKSTAILLMIMQASDAPLLIDQPEDDLDNRFIYDDVVMRLRAAKPLRQFVIATHNANIPVLGDAEQIIVLDATDKGGELKTRGAIDQADVREAAELILEGGEDAFLRRQAKYGWQ